MTQSPDTKSETARAVEPIPLADHEDTSIGGVTWHSSEEDGGPDVGISVYLGPDDRLWAGEINRRTFEEWEADINFDSDAGWFLVRYIGKEVKIIAKFGDYDEYAKEFMEQIAAWVRLTAASRAVEPRADAEGALGFPEWVFFFSITLVLFALLLIRGILT